MLEIESKKAKLDFNILYTLRMLYFVRWQNRTNIAIFMDGSLFLHPFG